MAATALVLQEASDGDQAVADAGPPPAILLIAMPLVLIVLAVIALAFGRLANLLAFNKPAPAMPERHDRQVAAHHFRVLPEPMEEHFAVLEDDGGGDELQQRCFICGGLLIDGDHDHNS